VIAFLVFLVAALVWVLVSGKLSRRSVTGPLALTVLGYLSTLPPIGLDLELDSERVRTLIEITLAVVLFSDASSIGVRWFRTEWRYPLRLLGIGLPLTILLGTLVAWWVFPGTDVWLLAVVAAALAPTDAALGASIIEDERIPLRLRQVINVESGLNDGLATPVVTFCIAIAAATLDGSPSRPFVSAIVEIVLGVAVGAGVGALGGRLAAAAGRRSWASVRALPLAPVLVAVGTYVAAVEVGGNGFVAAFVAGVAFGSSGDHERHDEVFLFTEQGGLLLGFAVWFVFGGGVLARISGHLSWTMALYAVLSLTVLRMLPVALSSIGTRLPWDTVVLAGWLGPRGLASIVFAILALDALGPSNGGFVVGVVGLTVALSVLAHGLSAGPLATWYSRRHPVAADAEEAPGPTGAPEASGPA
jgi:NhaP-type Na+/H+ or K+/H+ antiporter